MINHSFEFETEVHRGNHLEYPNVLAGVRAAAVDGGEALVACVDHGSDGEDLEVAAPYPRDLRERSTSKRWKTVSNRGYGALSFSLSRVSG